MTLIEALKSGKKFRRAGWKHWYLKEEQESFDQEGVLATDWEIEAEPKPKLKAWLSFRTQTELVSRSAVLYFLANGDEPDKTDDEFSKSFRRAPWLDEP